MCPQSDSARATAVGGGIVREAEYDFSQGKRRAIGPILPGKTRIAIWLDDEVLAWFREQVHLADGGNYQTLINEALRQYIQQSSEPLSEDARTH